MSKRGMAWCDRTGSDFSQRVGVTVGLLLTLAARFAVMRVTNLVVEIEPRWVLIAFLVGIIGGSVGALYPACAQHSGHRWDALIYRATVLLRVEMNTRS